jgi:hypothetical protein
MIYSNIKTYNFNKRQLNKIAKLSMRFCMETFGVNNRKRNDISLKVVHDVSDGYWGMYYPTENKIEVYPEECNTIGRFTSTIIHEYTHSMQKQDTRLYSRLIKEHGYYNHPQEVEARATEKKFNRALLRYLRENL